MKRCRKFYWFSLRFEEVMGFQSFQDFDVGDVADGLSFIIRAICTKDKINKCLFKKCLVLNVFFFKFFLIKHTGT